MADDINIDEIQSRLDELASALNSAASSLSSSMDDASKSSKKSAQSEDQATAATNKNTIAQQKATGVVDKRTEAEEEAAKKIKESNKEFSRAMGSAVESLQSFGNNLLSTVTSADKGFAKYGQGLENLGSAAVSVGDQFGPLGMVIGRVISAITIFASSGLEINQAISDTRVQINKFAGVLPITQAELGQLAADAQFSGTDIKKFGDVLSGLGPNVLGLGGNAAEASVRFLEIANVSDDVRRQFSRMGIEQDRLLELQGEYGAIQSASGLQALQALKTDKQIQKESLRYAESLTTISEITGLTAEQQRAEAEIVQNDLREKLATAQELQKVQDLIKAEKYEEAAALQDEIQKRKDAQNQLASVLGSDMATQISHALRTGAIDPTNSALAQLGISASELTKINEDSANGQEAAAKIQDLALEKMGEKIGALGNAARLMSDEQLKVHGLTRESVDNYLKYQNQQLTSSEQFAKADENLRKKILEGADKAVDEQTEIALAEQKIREEFNKVAKDIGNKILPIFTNLYKVVQPVISTLGDQLTPVFSKLIDNLQPFINVVGAVLTPVLETLGIVLPPLLDVFGGIASFLADILVPLFNFLGDVLKILGHIVAGILTPIETLGKITDSVVGAFQSVVDWISNLSFSDILPDLSLPEISLPEISLPEISLPSWLGGGGDDDKKEDKKEDKSNRYTRTRDRLNRREAQMKNPGAAVDREGNLITPGSDLGISAEMIDHFSKNKKEDEGTGFFSSLGDTLSGVGGTITDSLSGIGGTVTDVVGTAFDVATAPARLAFEGLQSVSGTVTDSLSGIGGTITDSLSGIGGTVTDVVGTAFDVATAPARLAFEGLQTVAGTVTDTLGSAFESLSDIGGTISDTMGSAFDTVTAPIVSVFDTLKDVAGSVGGIVSEKLKESFDLMYDIYDSIRTGLAGGFDTSTVQGRREFFEKGTDEDWSKLSAYNEFKEQNEQSGGNLYESEDELKKAVLDYIYGVAIDASTSVKTGSEIDEETGEQKYFKSVETWTESISALGEVAKSATKSGYDERLVSGDNPDGEIYDRDFSTRTQSRDEIIETKDYFREGARAVGDWFRELDSSVKMLVDSSPLDGPIPNATDKLVDDVVQQTEASTVATTDTAPVEQGKDTSLLEQLVQSQQMMINSLGSKLDNIVSALDDGNDTQAKILRNTY